MTGQPLDPGRLANMDQMFAAMEGKADEVLAFCENAYLGAPSRQDATYRFVEIMFRAVPESMSESNRAKAMTYIAGLMMLRVFDLKHPTKTSFVLTPPRRWDRVRVFFRRREAKKKPAQGARRASS